MNHDIRSLLLKVVLLLRLDCGTLTHVHVLVGLFTLTLLFIFLLILGATALGLEIFRSGIAGSIVISTGLLLRLYTLHLGVLSLGDGLLFLTTDFDVLLGSTLLELLSAVLGLVILSLVGLGLVRGELSRGALLAVPLDAEAGDSGLLGKDDSSDLLDDRLGGGLGGKLLVGVFVVDVVANADKLATVVGAGEEDDGDTENLGRRELVERGRVGFEDELVDTDWDWTDEERVEFLVVFGAVKGERVSGL